ncbi:hypothetical protein AOC36_00805 [Erysipelothrix larvae]|uniref:J domain-containing protein n=1 Tax=Erysipelothrix larvae TaxID=1514105 RepID=A0A109UGE2_9FIRM|nr:DnaJ domain-containing protein [Erysipelothrix larvae]AMC92582.1 hypothetical protein AOC36_00805 [Erysipelothrix larvae]
MSQKDYYKTLGVARDATQDQIKKAYRKMAQKYHPDVNKAPEAEAIMKEVNVAYDVLSDPNKKAQYDQFGSSGPNYGGYQQRPGGNGQQYTGGYSSFEDLFAEMLRQQQARQYQQTQYRRTTNQRPTTLGGLIFRMLYAMFVLQIILNILSFFFRLI